MAKIRKDLIGKKLVTKRGEEFICDNIVTDGTRHFYYSKAKKTCFRPELLVLPEEPEPEPKKITKKTKKVKYDKSKEICDE